MQETRTISRTAAAIFTVIAAAIVLTTQVAQACPPEIAVDPTTGGALPQPDLQAALAELEATVAVADAAR